VCFLDNLKSPYTLYMYIAKCQSKLIFGEVQATRERDL